MAGGQNRRRLDRETEAAAPRAWLRGAGRLGVALALAAGAVVGSERGWQAATRSQALRIRAFRFEGLRHASADELLALSPVKPGDHLLLADVGAMEAALARHPWVRRVRVRRGWPPALRVVVEERRAAALVELGGLYLVDDEASVFKRAAAGDGLDLPLVTGLSRSDYLRRRGEAEALLAGALALARDWRRSGRDAAARLSEIHLDPGDGTTVYVGEEGTQVRLGSGDLPQKLARLDKVLSALRAEGRRAEVLHLDNRLHPDWVTVRLAEASSAAAQAKVVGPRGP